MTDGRATYDATPSDLPKTTPDTAAVIVAAGTGTRFGDCRGKQFVELRGTPLVGWSVRAFDAAPSVGAIIVVCPPGRADETRNLLRREASLGTPVSVAEGGATRQESVAHGLALVAHALVAVHDGARPLVTQATIETVIAAVRNDTHLAGAIAAAPVTDTLKHADVQGRIARTVDRSCLWAAMTPQVFRTNVLREAYATAAVGAFCGTDDASLVEHAGGRVACVTTSRSNIKVTFPEDLDLAEALLARVGGRGTTT